MIEKFLKSRVGIILISIIWGLGLATLFKIGCTGNNCKVIEYRGPPISDADYAWNYGDDKCYSLQPYVTKCDHP